jgi:hypothetical protein
VREGLLWFDDDPRRDLAEKVRRAAARYRQKHGRRPNVCYVHPSTLGGNGEVQQAGDVRVAPLTSVLRHHFWVGEEDGRGGGGQGEGNLLAQVEAESRAKPMTRQLALEMLGEAAVGVER